MTQTTNSGSGGGLMWQKNIPTVSLVIIGVLLIAIVAPNSRWGWNAQDHVNVPVVNASWTQHEPAAGGNSGLTHITVAPPYIILDVRPDLARQVSGEGQIRISIQTMSGSYSEYVASSTATSVAMPVLYIGSVRPGTVGQTRSDLAFWD